MLASRLGREVARAHVPGLDLFHLLDLVAKGLGSGARDERADVLAAGALLVFEHLSTSFADIACGRPLPRVLVQERRRPIDMTAVAATNTTEAMSASGLVVGSPPVRAAGLLTAPGWRRIAPRQCRRRPLQAASPWPSSLGPWPWHPGDASLRASLWAQALRRRASASSKLALRRAMQSAKVASLPKLPNNCEGHGRSSSVRFSICACHSLQG